MESQSATNRRSRTASICLATGLLFAAASFAAMLLAVEPSQPLGLNTDQQFYGLFAAGAFHLIAWIPLTVGGFLKLRSRGYSAAVVGIGAGMFLIAAYLVALLVIFDEEGHSGLNPKQKLALAIPALIAGLAGWILLFVGGYHYLRDKGRIWLWLLVLGTGIPGLIVLVILPSRKRKTVPAPHGT